MFAAFGILLLVLGAALTFAVEREVDGVDLQLVGWILMAGGGAALIAAMVRFAALGTITSPDRRPDRPEPVDHSTRRDGELDHDLDHDYDHDVERVDESRHERRSA